MRVIADLAWYGVGRWRGAQALALLGKLSRHAAAATRAKTVVTTPNGLGNPVVTLPTAYPAPIQDPAQTSALAVTMMK